MEVEITIKNYRCFPDAKPARITISEGFHAFVGVNNSGKSSLLRFFYEFRALFQKVADEPGVFAAALRGEQQNFGNARSVSDYNEIFNNTNDRDIEIGIQIIRGPGGEQPATGARSTHPGTLVLSVSRKANAFTAQIPGINKEHARTVLISEDGPVIGNTFRLGMIQSGCRMLANTLYIGPFRNAINVGASNDYYDIKLGQAFITEWREHKAGAAIIRNEAIIKLTDDIRRIFEFDRLEIDASTDNTNLKVFVNNKSFKLTELGAGITQFILVLANASIRRPSLILIDEPETNLHPSLQIDFLTTLASYAATGILFGTHSIGLARATANRIYSLRKMGEGETEVRDFEATPKLSEFVGEMGFSGYQELGYDKILLVEGPTDVTTFQQFLRTYGKDHKIVILPLGGRSFITAASAPQLGELKRITNKITAVIDSERVAAGAALEPDRQAFVDECRKLDIDCLVLQRRATENYFSDGAVKAVKGPKFKALSHYEDLGSMSPSWHKRENWKIAREMKKGDLDPTDLGGMLDSL